jgi:excisionase family DNA binding protein
LNRKPLIGINEASQILGVSEATLRQWTDEGRIKAFVTPGGHRRYSKEELEEFVVSHENLLGVKDLVGKLEETAETHREIGAAFLNSTVWYERMSAEHKKMLAILGRQILDLMMTYMASPDHKTTALLKAREIGHGFGDMLASEGVPLTDSVQAFISHRDPISHIISEMLRKKELVGPGVLASMPLMEQVMDSALVSLVEAHQLQGKPLQG